MKAHNSCINCPYYDGIENCNKGGECWLYEDGAE